MANAKQTRMIKVNESRHMVITPLARASFPQLFEARSFQNDPTKEKEFKVDLLLDPADIVKKGRGAKGETPSLKEAYYNACKDQWGPDKAKWPKMRYGFDDVFSKGDDKRTADGEPYEGYEGKIVVTAKAKEKYPPKVFDRYGQPLAEGDMYGGCYVQAKLIARPYDYAGNRGVSFKLYQVIKVKDGDKFGGGGNSELAFAVEEDASDQFEGGNDESEDNEDW